MTIDPIDSPFGEYLLGPGEYLVSIGDITIVMGMVRNIGHGLIVSEPVASISEHGVRQPLHEDTRLKQVGHPPCWVSVDWEP